MHLTFRRLLAVLFCLSACCIPLHSQDQKTITLRMLNGKTGELIATTNFLVRVNHEDEVHANWVQQNEDGTGRLTLPPTATLFSVHATYESATRIYINCDSDKEKPSNEHQLGIDHWYPVESILTSGVVAPNNCAGKKIPERLQVIAKPGEFVFFVRPLNAREQMSD
jgi:hypothetical protein